MTDRLIYLPLGGAGEVGMNAYVYGWGPEDAERLILVECGVSFPDMETTPGVDLILPDLTWLFERAERLEAIFITHGHEDHVGALAHVWPRLKAPVYARPFTAALARLKMEEAGLPKEAVRVTGPRPAVVEAGPFRVSFQPVSHSIPECSALVIDTPGPRVVHSGDFKIDPDPVVGEPWDGAAMAAIAAERPIHALVCDSTNVFSTHAGRSESSLAVPIGELVRQSRGMFVATTFASNVARVKTLAQAGVAAGRSVCLLGRAMQKMVKVAGETGVLSDLPRTLSAEEAVEVPRQDLMLIVTGSQGERRAATAQLARGRYLGFEMKEGDTFLFSSKTIPGNERAVIGIMNALSEAGVDVVDDRGGLYHVSGHANRPDLEAVHALLKPRMVVPMHGDHRMLREHARVAAAAGIASEVASNGMMLDLTGEAPQVAEFIEAGRVYLDGSVLIGAKDGVVRDRIRMALNGHVLVTVILDEDDAPLGEAWVELMGLPAKGRGGADLAEALERALTDQLDTMGPKIRGDDERLDEVLRRTVRQVTADAIGKKPEVTVVVSRLAEG